MISVEALSITVPTGYARASTVSPSSCAVVPRPITENALMNSRNSETARISSGVMNENIITKFVVVAVRPRERVREGGELKGRDDRVPVARQLQGRGPPVPPSASVRVESGRRDRAGLVE